MAEERWTYCRLGREPAELWIRNGEIKLVAIRDLPDSDWHGSAEDDIHLGANFKILRFKYYYPESSLHTVIFYEWRPNCYISIGFPVCMQRLVQVDTSHGSQGTSTPPAPAFRSDGTGGCPQGGRLVRRRVSSHGDEHHPRPPMDEM